MRRCGVCRGTGHNRATCPNSSNVVAKDATKSETISSAPSYRRKASCSYCLRREFKVDRTHTVRTCPKRIEQRQAWIEENASWCYKHRMDMMQIGWGPGAIVECDGIVYQIDKIKYDELSHTNLHGYLATRIDVEADPYYGGRYRLSPVAKESEIKVLSPLPPEMVERSYPKDWDYGEYAIPNFLRNSNEKK